MIVAKLNCTQMLVKSGDGRIFMVDRRTPDRMSEVGVSPPAQEGEPTKTIIPFQPKHLFKLHPLADMFKQILYPYSKEA